MNHQTQKRSALAALVCSPFFFWGSVKLYMAWDANASPSAKDQALEACLTKAANTGPEYRWVFTTPAMERRRTQEGACWTTYLTP